MCNNKKYKVVSVTDELHYCDNCGKELSRTYVLKNLVSGEFMYFGSDCAARLLNTSINTVQILAKQANEQRFYAAVDKIICSGHTQAIISLSKIGLDYSENVSDLNNMLGFVASEDGFSESDLKKELNRFLKNNCNVVL